MRRGSGWFGGMAETRTSREIVGLGDLVDTALLALLRSQIGNATALARGILIGITASAVRSIPGTIPQPPGQELLRTPPILLTVLGSAVSAPATTATTATTAMIMRTAFREHHLGLPLAPLRRGQVGDGGWLVRMVDLAPVD